MEKNRRQETFFKGLRAAIQNWPKKKWTKKKMGSSGFCKVILGFPRQWPVGKKTRSLRTLELATRGSLPPGSKGQRGTKRAQKAPKGPKKGPKGPKGPKGAKSAQNTVKIARKLARKAKISTLGGTIMRVAGPCGSIVF